MTKNPSAIVIGGGHNGLVCAAYLAKAGFGVTLLEARESVGGGLSHQVLKDGTEVPGLVDNHFPLNERIAKELRLSTDEASDSVQTVLLDPNGENICLSGSSIAGPGVNAADEAEYKAFREEYLSYAKALKSLMLNTPPRLKHFDWTDKKTFTKLGLNLRFGLGKAGLREFLRVAGMNLFDMLEERFSSELLKGGIAADALFGHHAGPKTPTTVLTMIMRLFQEEGARTGRQLAAVANLTDQLVATATAAGVDIRTNTRVTSVLTEHEAATGVLLESGEQMSADIVVSNADAKTTFLELVGTRQLDAMFSHRVSKTRTNGDVVRYFAVFDEMPIFTYVESAENGKRLLVAPTMKYVERAFNHSKYGEYSEAPVLDVNMQRSGDAKCIMTVNAMYAPYNLKQGWETGRDGFKDKILDTLSFYAPGISTKKTLSELWSPQDIEERFNVTGGHWHHGEMALDQAFMMRPVPGAGQYQTPLPGLYLCGAAAHPGGDITGLPGRNAARQILADSKRQR